MEAEGLLDIEADSRRPSIVYEEDMSVIVRRRGVTMTVRIFGAEDDAVTSDSKKKSRSRSRSDSSSPTKKLQSVMKRKRSCKSVSALDEVIKVKSSNLRRHYFKKLQRTISSLSPDQSGDDVSPTMSPTTPDSLALLRPESPTKGLGQFHKGRSSSIATPGSQHFVGLRFRSSSRRFSADSVPRRRIFRIFSREFRQGGSTPGGSPMTLSPYRRSLDVDTLSILHHSRFGSSGHRLSRELSVTSLSSRSLNTVTVSGTFSRSYFTGSAGNLQSGINLFLIHSFILSPPLNEQI